jgi:2-dehydropantoate 2-reductase
MAAGGIGGYYGGLLAQAGHDVIFVARGAHLQAIRARGLHVKSTDDEFQIQPARVTENPAEIGPVDLVLFSVKTYDTDRAAELIRPIVNAETVVVTFQNGIESEARIRAGVGKGRVVSAPTQIETFIAEPGRIEQTSNFRVVTLAQLDVDSLPQIAALADVFRRNNVTVNLTSDMRRALWNKFIRLAPVAGLATLARTAPHDLWQIETARETLDAAVREAFAVGRAEGVALDESDLAGAYKWALDLKPGLKPSMQKDVERGNRLEIDALSGAIVRLGKQHGIATPIHQTIYVGLKPVDEQNRRAREDK